MSLILVDTSLFGFYTLTNLVLFLPTFRHKEQYTFTSSTMDHIKYGVRYRGGGINVLVIPEPVFLYPHS